MYSSKLLEVEDCPFSSSAQESKHGCSIIQVASMLTVCALISPELFVSNIALRMCLRENPISKSGAAIGGGGGEFDLRLIDHKSSSDSEFVNNLLLLLEPKITTQLS